ncbi:MAG TPA: hypothetical protein DD429_07235 [Clostridiaceae bacterium]|nr:hypothetical protein [Clostridiaceae bacterium]
MSSKRPLLERLHIVEKVESDTEQNSASEKIITDDPDVKTTVHTSNNLLDDIPIKDRPMKVKEIYIKAGQLSDGINTIFIIENYSNALPMNLPSEVKKQSVLNLITASGLNMQNIIRDGHDKLRLLNAFLHNFSSKTNEVITNNESEINKLTEKINQLKKANADMEKLMQEQKSIIEFEEERIQGLIDFVGDTKSV